MLKIANEEHFARVCDFAQRTGQSEQLWEQLLYLHQYADQPDAGAGDLTGWCKGNMTVELRPDWAPASFNFSAVNNVTREFWFTGGLIYHGDQRGWDEKDEYVDPLSVRIGHNNSAWSIHT